MNEITRTEPSPLVFFGLGDDLTLLQQEAVEACEQIQSVDNELEFKLAKSALEKCKEHDRSVERERTAHVRPFIDIQKIINDEAKSRVAAVEPGKKRAQFLMDKYAEKQLAAQREAERKQREAEALLEQERRKRLQDAERARMEADRKERAAREEAIRLEAENARRIEREEQAKIEAERKAEELAKAASNASSETEAKAIAEEKQRQDELKRQSEIEAKKRADEYKAQQEAAEKKAAADADASRKIAWEAEQEARRLKEEADKVATTVVVKADIGAKVKESYDYTIIDAAQVYAQEPDWFDLVPKHKVISTAINIGTPSQRRGMSIFKVTKVKP